MYGAAENWGVYTGAYPADGEATPYSGGTTNPGLFWKNLGGWNGGVGTTYPKLYWETP